MKAPTLSMVMRMRVLLFALCVVFNACQSRKSDGAPSIEFSKIPPAAQGGPDKVDIIAGRVRGFRPGEQIIIYAHSGPWWIQPYYDHPFVAIQSDSTWSTATHLGLDYAALLVEPGYHPPATLDIAPTAGGSVVSVAIVKGTGPPTFAPTKPLKFSGYDWSVRTIASNRGGSYNLYDPDNAWTDSSGALHMRINNKSGPWNCAQLGLDRSLGYGTYILTVRDISQLEPAAVLSMYTFDEWHGDQYYREMDVELSRWGDATRQSNAQFGVQPFYIPGNIYPFNAPAGPLTYSMLWKSGSVAFRTVRGLGNRSGSVIAQHEFTSGVPSPGQEQVKLDFYAVPSEKYPLQKGSEVVIEKFEYLP
jgi:hypothetical protein